MGFLDELDSAFDQLRKVGQIVNDATDVLAEEPTDNDEDDGDEPPPTHRRGDAR